MAALGYGVRGIGGYSVPSNQRQPTGAPMAGGLSYGAAPQQRRMPMGGQQGGGSDTLGQLGSGVKMAGLANTGYEYLSGSPTGLAGGLGMAGGMLGGASALNRVSEGKGTPMDYYTLAKLGYNVSTMGAGAGAGTGAGAAAAGAGEAGAGTGTAAAGAGGGSNLAAAMGPLSLFLGGASLMNAVAERDTAKSIAGGQRTYQRLLDQGVNPRDLTAASMFTGTQGYTDPWVQDYLKKVQSGAYMPPSNASDEQAQMARQGVLNTLAQYKSPHWGISSEFEKKYPGAAAAAGLPSDLGNLYQILPDWSNWMGQLKAPGEKWYSDVEASLTPKTQNPYLPTPLGGYTSG